MTEILKGIHYVDETNANSYFVEESDGTLTLVDASMQPNGRKILDYLTTKMMRKPADLKTVVITHCHVDHIRGAAALKAATGARVAIHEADADYLSGKSRYPPPPGAMGLLFRLLSPMFSVKPVEPDIRLKEGDKVGKLTVLHTPGHTPGSISLYDQQDGALFVGDNARFLKGRLVGPPRQFTPDIGAVKADLERCAGLDFQTLLSGHGRPLQGKDVPQRLMSLTKDL